jgi:DNA polymerase-4
VAPPRRILLVDADAFFVAVARQEDPEGAGRARLLIVGGRPGSRGVVCSASYECRAYGVRSAMPIARALRLCPEALCVPVPRQACARRSREIRDVLHRFAPVVQPSSIDEWYCDLGGTETLYGEPLDATAHRIRDAVFAGTGLLVSIGGGTSRLVAKVAVERAKPKAGSGATGVHIVPPGTEAAFLAGFALADLPLVGPRFAERLARLGLVTVADAQGWPEEALVRQLGPRAGHWLWRRVRGLDDTPVLARDAQKQVSREETFAADLHDEAVLRRELLRLAVRVSADLRGHGLAARTVTVKLRDADFRTRSARRTLEAPIESERSVARVATALFERLRRQRRTGVRLLGIALSHLDAPRRARASPVQLGLFAPDQPARSRVAAGTRPSAPGGEVAPEPIEGERDRALTRALDRIRGRYGAGAIVPAPLVTPRDAGPRVER